VTEDATAASVFFLFWGRSAVSKQNLLACLLTYLLTNKVKVVTLLYRANGH